MPRKARDAARPALTTAQALGALLKSARDIMRKDKGLNGDLDRLPLLTWIMFLKFLDDLERQREAEAALAGTRFRPAIEPPYRWRDWAANPQGITGDELLAFINGEETVRPDGTRGPGLFAYLRALTSENGDDRRDVIATVFRGVDNRMRSGYLLRDVIDKVNGIHFTSSEELHTLGALYESMLREMRDAAGDSGEFYTPRAVVRLMVQVTDPRLGETVLDPAAGTGGFLVEAFAHLSAQVRTVAERKVLQQRSLFGCEPKPLPYLLCQMNLLLHGLDAPRIDPGNALRHRLAEIGERDRVDVILTNPPFGGEEERGIQDNFPEDRRTAETALLFLQLIMRRLKRAPTSAGRPARAAVVVPNGTLFGDGVAARIKADLLEQFNLHTVLRLPEGVFAPYTDIPTNVIFFDTSGPTREIWFYEQPLPEGRRKYTKTRPIQFEEFSEFLAWWGSRAEGPRAWKVDGPGLIRRDEAGRVVAVNLDLKNPAARAAEDHRAPAEIVTSALAKEREVLALLEELRALVDEGPG
ncbi:type I restriction-modification system subunit M [Caldovatus aquaticus]|uniref:site-specific DNA-methyltransferase (adenine-specific) n=1 Tax=Caldovatus aquaticus TaxID=2865671 RepID=A0ABS7F413_9PROT|nr:class I SAM-dependent DNA methyltransferase [Caldovatus aquaticus]MBW8270348.1 type I restriction-modification system subunit M [Caldovatus aquaticus]